METLIKAVIYERSASLVLHSGKTNRTPLRTVFLRAGAGW
jgi:hypothetical protein